MHFSFVFCSLIVEVSYGRQTLRLTLTLFCDKCPFALPLSFHELVIVPRSDAEGHCPSAGAAGCSEAEEGAGAAAPTHLQPSALLGL